MRKRKLVKIMAVFMAVQTLYASLLPTLTYALTSGPTAPEYSSFEPVDTTNMVNLVTGDFVYNIPLLEVPGPAGGYPISLSYHAGIQTNQDASWTGLGWTLNVGAINRTVNGYADDVFDASRSVVDDWEGGESWSVGVGYGHAGTYAKLTYAEDTYKGSGFGFSVGQNYKIGPVGGQVAYTQGPFGGSNASFSTGIGIGGGQAVNAAISLGANINLKSGDIRSGVAVGLSSVGGQTLVGASLSSNQVSSVSVGSFSVSQVNKNAGNITNDKIGGGIVIPTQFGDLHLEAQYNRYYSHEESYVGIYGSLYPRSNFDSYNSSFDSYPVLDSRHNLTDDIETHSLGGFPAYDNFSVLGQGLGGHMQPYILEFGALHRQSDNNVNFEKLDKSFTKKVNFRFKNDFSGYYIHDAPSLDTQGQGTSFEFKGFNDDENFDYPANGLNPEKNHLAGSNHIEWFTNMQVNTGEAFQKGLLAYDNSMVRPIRFSYGGTTYDINKQIGGFKITNPSGVNYHYALPVYAYDEHTRSEILDKSGGEIYRETTNLQPYAYTWLLTAVTGPDYVDRNKNNIPDEGDWGYWVRFHYGKWTSNYQWRNPAIGNHVDLDQSIGHWSWGKKELYYLDAIETATHTALFVKEVRDDGKSVTTPKGGSEPDLNKWIFPTSVLGLNEIYLFNNRDLESFTIDELTSLGETLDFGTSVNHLGDNILDLSDFTYLNDLKSRSLRVISLETCYSLCSNTINSLDNDKLYQPNPIVAKTGKYTLKSLDIKGKGGTSLTPPTEFAYGFNPDYDEMDYDIWGFYKDVPENVKDENLDRLTTEASQANVDAWSLEKIITPLGAEIEINYESDTYTSPEYYNGSIFQIDDIQVENEDQGVVSLQLDPDYYQYLENVLNSSTAPESVGFTVLIAQPYDYLEQKVKLPVPDCEVEITYKSDYVAYRPSQFLEIKKIEGNKIFIQDSDLVKLLTTRKEGKCTLSSDGFHDCNRKSNCYQYDPVFVGGSLSLNVEYNFPGGGLRVKQISVSEGFSSTVKTTSYKYHDLEAPEKTSGVTSYEPVGIGYYQFEKPETPRHRIRHGSTDYLDHYDNFHEGLKEFRGALIEERRLLQQSRNIPSPGVFYKNVTVKDEIFHKDTHETFTLPQYRVYGFNVFELNKTVKFSTRVVPLGAKSLYKTGVDIFDYSSKLGQPDFVKTFSAASKDGLIEEIDYIYADEYSLDDEVNKNIGNQGQFKQVFYEYKTVTDGFYVDDSEKAETDLIQFSSIVERPSVLIKTISKNYITGVATSKENIDFDLFSGAPTKSLTRDSYGNYYLSETVPAYTVPAYSAMGLAINGGRHMLSQQSAQYTYKAEGRSGTKQSLISASIQTWSDKIPVLNEGTQAGIYREYATYSWDGNAVLNGDGTYPIKDFEQNPFSFDDLANNSSWIKNSEIMLVDVNSHALEARDINGNHAAMRMDPDNVKIIASAVNASYYEMAYSGAEHIIGNGVRKGDVSKGDGFASTARRHTGRYSLQVPFNSEGFNYTLNNNDADLDKKYRASVWVYLPGESETTEEIKNAELFCHINGQEFKVHPELQENKSKSWYLLELIIDPKGAKEVFIGCRNKTSRNIYFDDFRVFPITASMTSYVYDQSTDELTYILDNNNLYTHFEYDAEGRLVRTSQELLNFNYGGMESFRADKILSETSYNYGRNNKEGSDEN